jgi:hypothetical protein
MRVYSRFVQKALARRAIAVITISNYSRNQISREFNIPLDRINPIHLAPSEVFYPLERSVVRDYVVSHFDTEGYVLAIASAVPRKNTSRLLQAYAMLHQDLRRKHPLVLVCTHLSLERELLGLVTTLGIKDDVVFLQRVSNDELSLLYNGARLFVFPSLEEGFGLPPVEAMACGAPVIASNVSSMPEVLGEAALLVPPRDAQVLSEAMTEVLANRALAAELRARGLRHSRQFSWEETARKTLAVYEAVWGA